MISYKFNEKKAIQLIAFFLKQSTIDNANYTKIIKLLYLADREALKRWGRTITKDVYANLPAGPIVSETYDLIKTIKNGTNEFIGSKSEYDLELKIDPDDDELSNAEIRILSEISEKYKNKTFQQMIKVVHNLPEWVDPKPRGRKSLSVENILEALAKTDEEIKEIEVSNKEENYLINVLGS